MDDESRAAEGEPEGAGVPPAFDKAAARRRYRAMMRGRTMRTLYALLALVLLIAWGFGIAAVFASDIERLPGHDLTVPPRQCVACHARQPAAPPMPHIGFPSCGFCHRQAPPPPARTATTQARML